jgi:hypothetical protein
MTVSLGKTDQTYFAVSQFAQVSGLALSNQVASAAVCAGAGGQCYFQSIGVGPNAEGSSIGDPWIIGTSKVGNDYHIYRRENSKWVQEVGAGTLIAVSPNGYAWTVNHVGSIYYWNGTSFALAPGNGCATSIGVGPNAFGSKYGNPWVIGCDGGVGVDGSIFQLQGSTWVKQPGAATQIAVSPAGVPWVVNAAGAVYYWNGSGFTKVPSGCATSIGVGPATAPLAGPLGDVWITGCTTVASGGYGIYQLQHGTSWVSIPGGANQISVSPDLGVPWTVTIKGNIGE